MGEQLIHLALDIAIASEAKLRYGDLFWTGEDGATEESVILPSNIPTIVEGEGTYIKSSDGGVTPLDPSTEVPIRLKPGSFPQLSALRFLPDSAELPTPAPMLGYIYEQQRRPFLLASTKSRFAQIGVEVSDWQTIPASVWRQLASGKEIIVPMRVNNYAARPVHIPAAMPLFRFIAPMRARSLEGEQLVHAYRNGLIEVEGLQGETWEWTSTDENDPQGLRNPKGIYGMRVKLTPDLRWIPPSDEPIRMEDFIGPHYREKIDELLRPAPDTDQPILCIAETYPLRLAASVSGYISIAARGFGRQINSRYIDPLSKWGIRVEEILSPAMARENDRYMEIYFYKSAV